MSSHNPFDNLAHRHSVFYNVALGSQATAGLLGGQQYANELARQQTAALGGGLSQRLLGSYRSDARPASFREELQMKVNDWLRPVNNYEGSK